MEAAAGAFGVKLQYRDVLDAKEIDTAFREASKEHADAVLVLASSVLVSERMRIIDLAIKNRIPAIYPGGEYVEEGGLMSYDYQSQSGKADRVNNSS
jgi:putative ABC transport system substrate-binding protein